MLDIKKVILGLEENDFSEEAIRIRRKKVRDEDERHEYNKNYARHTSIIV